MTVDNRTVKHKRR